MATFSHLPSGKWRAQVRRAGLYRNATFEKKRDAEAWASGDRDTSPPYRRVRIRAHPQRRDGRDLIDKYVETFAKTPGKTKTATLGNAQTRDRENEARFIECRSAARLHRPTREGRRWWRDDRGRPAVFCRRC